MTAENSSLPTFGCKCEGQDTAVVVLDQSWANPGPTTELCRIHNLASPFSKHCSSCVAHSMNFKALQRRERRHAARAMCHSRKGGGGTCCMGLSSRAPLKSAPSILASVKSLLHDTERVNYSQRPPRIRRSVGAHLRQKHPCRAGSSENKALTW